MPEVPRGESTTTDYRVNYQLCSNATEIAQWETPSCSRPQPAHSMESETEDPIDWPFQIIIKLYNLTKRN